MSASEPAVHIVADHVGPRLQYACKLFWERILGLSHKVYSTAEYTPQAIPVLFYGNAEPALPDSLPKAVILKPHGLLQQTGTAYVPDLHTLEHDPLSSVFWLATHYAAYAASHRHDHHGRPERALLPSHQDPYRPVCHELAADLAARLGLLPAKREKLAHVPTLDIDNAFAYQAKGPVRWLGALLRELGAGGAKALKNRLLHALGRIADPYDTHELILKTLEPHNLRVFFLMASSGAHDHAIDTAHPDFKRLVRMYADAGASVGLHPSSGGGQTLNKVLQEKETLEKMLGASITQTRHHYLRLLTPHTQRLLLQLGMRDDYSPGPIEPGFWQGISVPIPWYDVEHDEETQLELYPAAWMDVHHAHHPEAGLQLLIQLQKNLAPYGGQLISIWHNDYFKRFSESPSFLLAFSDSHA
jgi:hypothetical protein